jgi:phage tail tube protein FII
LKKPAEKKEGQWLPLAGDLEVKIGFDGSDLRFTQGAATADILKKLGDRAVRQIQPLAAFFLDD